MRRKNPAAAGFTLVELVVTIVILGVALAAVAAMVGLGVNNSANTLLETRAIELGYAYLDEILGRRFDERSAASGRVPCHGLLMTDPNPCSTTLGPDGGSESSRDRYDDVDDYNNLAEGDGTATPIKDAAGATRSGYDNFVVAVSVRYAGNDAEIGRAQTDAKLITVTVTHPDQTSGWQFSVYKGNY